MKKDENAALLTIAIPTFDRPSRVLARVRELLAQPSPRVRLLVLDNHSTPPVGDYLATQGCDTSRINLRRNPVNIGANANLCRCMELCETPWLWILGDDDCLEADAVEAALAAIAAHPDALHINFRADNVAVDRLADYATCGIDDFVRRVDSLHYILLTSSNLMRIEKIRPLMHVVYHFAYTCLPHFVALHQVLVREPRGQVVFLRRRLIRPDPTPGEGGWSRAQVWLSVLTLLELPMPQSRRAALVPLLIVDRWDVLRYAKCLLETALASGDWAAVSYYLALYYGKRRTARPEWGARLQYALARAGIPLLRGLHPTAPGRWLCGRLGIKPAGADARFARI